MPELLLCVGLLNLLLKMDLAICFCPIQTLLMLSLIGDLLCLTCGLFSVVSSQVLESSLVILTNFAYASKCEFVH